jgi:hypothetical protein
MPLPFPPSTIGSIDGWSDVIATKSANFYNGEIQIVDLNSDSITDYDGFSDTGGESSPVLLWQGAARITNVRRPRELNTTYESRFTSGYRFQVAMDDTLPFLREGLNVIVVNGGNDTQLENMCFVIAMGAGGSWATSRTIETNTEIAPVTMTPLTGPPLNQGAGEDEGYVFTQSTALATWTITNTLGRLPDITIATSRPPPPKSPSRSHPPSAATPYSAKGPHHARAVPQRYRPERQQSRQRRIAERLHGRRQQGIRRQRGRRHVGA